MVTIQLKDDTAKQLLDLVLYELRERDRCFIGNTELRELEVNLSCALATCQCGGK